MEQKNMQCFSVEAVCGHVGRGKGVVVTFPVIAPTRQDAVNKLLGRDGGRKKGRIKISSRTGNALILSASPITRERYAEIVDANRNDQYLSSTCRQDDNAWNPALNERVFEIFDRYASVKGAPAASEPTAFRGKTPIRSIKSYLRTIDDEALRISAIRQGHPTRR